MKKKTSDDSSFTFRVKRDLKHHLDGTFYANPLQISLSRILRAFISPEFRVLFWFRVYHSLHKKGFRVIAYLMYQHVKRRFSCDIAPEANLAEGIRIVHCSNIVIGPLASIGSDSVIFNGVTLGNKDVFNNDWEMPQVGENVLLGVGAKLLGGISVGNFAQVGANAVVIRDVPSCSVAVGIPAKIVKKSKRCNE